MTSTRKSRITNKRFLKANQESPDKDESNTNKSKIRKRKLSDMLGSQWSKEELERFYEAYRKFGKDWKKVSGTIRNRSADTVEALYNMNRAYLSLPEGTATAAGLIAMMTDHYNILEGSDSEKESNDGLQTSHKPQKRGRGKFRPNMSKGSDASYPDLLQYQSVTPTYGCLSLLKKKRSGGSRPRAVGKRTPRFPVSYTHDKQDRDQLKQGMKSEGNVADDEGVHVAALALAEACQRGGSPQVSRTPGKRTKQTKSSPVQSIERKHAESPGAYSKLIGNVMDEYGLEGSLGSREAENGDFVRDSGYMLDTESAGAVETQRKMRKFQGKRQKALRVETNQLDDVREACSGTEEGLLVGSTKNEFDIEVTDRKVARSSQDTRKRNRQLFSGDENTALDALQTLADLSFNILLPGSAVESESSVQPKEEKQIADVVEKLRAPKTMWTNNKRVKRKLSSKKVKVQHSTTGMDVATEKSSKLQKGLSLDAKESSKTKQPKKQKRKPKPMEAKVPKAEVREGTCPIESQKTEVVVEEAKKSISKAKRASQIVPIQKQGKSTRALEQVSSSPDQGKTVTDLAESAPQICTTNHSNLPTKHRSRRKIDLQKALARKELKSSENAGDDRSDRYSVSVNGSTVDLREKLSHCLSSQMLRRWCMFEWFYSAIDYPWFAKSEFVEYLNHVGLGHVPRLTRVEWGVIRSSLGKPRRLSEQFLQEEREKLEQYRESVRTHYAELRAGVREGLPTDLARPLSVGQRVVACHPKTRGIHDGSVLTVDRNRCRVQFDRPELGVEFVMDIDCMPLNPAENIPDALRRPNFLVDKFFEGLYETKLYGQPKEWKFGESMKFASNETLETADGSCHIASSNYPMNTLMKQAKGDTIDAIVEAKAAANEVAVAAQKAMYNLPCTLAQIQAREADIRALADLTRALDKKEALLIELRNMNEEVSTKQREGDSIREFDHFRKQYAMLLFQSQDANDQVASALFYLRQRNTYHGNSTPPWLRSMDNSGGPVGPLSNLKHTTFLNQETGTHVLNIVEALGRKARAMVDVAVKAMSSLKEGEDAFLRIGEALNSTRTWQTGADSGVAAVKSVPISDPGHGYSALQDQISACKLEPTTVHALSPRSKISSNGNESQPPSELISSCVATLLMIQTCTERHDPPAEVAQILDSAITYLHPCCSQNLPIYREIELCMGIIKNQMLAKIPTPSTVLPATDLTIV